MQVLIKARDVLRQVMDVVARLRHTFWLVCSQEESTGADYVRERSINTMLDVLNDRLYVMLRMAKLPQALRVVIEECLTMSEKPHLENSLLLASRGQKRQDKRREPLSQSVQLTWIRCACCDASHSEFRK